MKVVRSVAGITSLLVILFSLQTNLVSCKKQIVTDTVIVKDTVTVVDSIYCHCYNLNDGLIAYYNFNGGNLNDSSGNKNNIVLNNGATLEADRYGHPNNAYRFNGTSNYMQVKNSASLNPTNITIAAIVKLNGFYKGACHGNNILQKGTVDQNQGVYALRVNDITHDCSTAPDTTKETFGGLYGDYGAAVAVNDTGHVATAKWYEVVYTYDGHYSKLYVDGVLRAYVTGTATFSPTTQDLFIGRAESAVYPYWFNGVIDEIRIYNKALCDGAIKQLYDVKTP